MSILQELESSEAQYDAHVKRILCNRYVLAWILKNTTEEFCGIPINQIAEECISEDKVPGEGGIFYDIRFSAYMPGKAGATKILLNLEAQKTFGEEMSHMCNLGEGIRENALEEGIEIGMEKGIEKGMLELICKKLRKNKTPDIIAEELEEDSEKIQNICEMATAFAPDYDCDKVYEAWKKETT